MELAEQIQTFQEFIEAEYYDQLLENVRTGKEYLVIEFPKLARFNPDLASLLLDKAEDVIKAAEMSLKNFDIQLQEEFYIRFKDLPETQETMIRHVRAKHLTRFLQMDGIVRQKSDVRPQVTSARFECPSCGNIIPVLQLDQKFKEPSRCGCGRKGQFRLLSKKLVDAQKIVLEENPEELEGGEQPKRLNIFLKNDLVSPMTDKQTNPGSKVRVTGVIKEVPITLQQGGQSVRFDLMLEANFVEPLQEDYSQIQISKEEEDKILELGANPGVFGILVDNLAPNIYGHAKVKEALLLQLLGGVNKVRGEGGGKSRGDIHVLLIGDPGAGKCVAGDTLVQQSNGEILTIESMYRNNKGAPLGEDAFAPREACSVLSMGLNGKCSEKKVPTLWSRKATRVLNLTLQSGEELVVTPEHPLFTAHNAMISSVEAQELMPGMHIATPRSLTPQTSLQCVKPWRKSKAQNKVSLSPGKHITTEIGRLFGYLTGDGWVQKGTKANMVSLTNNDEETLDDFTTILTHLGTNAYKRNPRKGKTATEIYSSSSEFHSFIKENAPELVRTAGEKSVPMVIQRSPTPIVASFLKALFECDAHVSKRSRSIEFVTKSRRLAREVKMLLLRFGILSQLRTKEKCATNTVKKIKRCYYEIRISGEDVTRYAEKIGFISKRKQTTVDSYQTKHNTNKDVVPGMSLVFKILRKRYKKMVREMPIPAGSYRYYEKGDRLPSIKQAQKILKQYPEDELVQLAQQFVAADVFWDRVVSIEEFPGEMVYDIEVEQTHNFVANTVFVHNSQLLKRVSHVAPKARFVSGKGASGAGLTASVVRDEFLKGWALEAGALVLANKGLCCIDELDKMTPEDRSAMHEALEQQTVTISKANIQATLRSETTVLAAANPKFGRFDPYELLAKQIELPSTLINRFDLIFPIRDMPDRENDERLASFLLKLHQSTENNEGEYDADFLRKFISYAKQRVKPVITNEALEEIKKYYIKMRGSGSDSDGAIKAIPISARQLEALVRLTEASAKVRLSKKAEKKDAKVAIDLVHHTLSAIGLDPETGKFDIDRITTGVTASQRSTIAVVKEIVSELEAAVGKVIPVEDIVREAEIKGVNEDNTVETLEKLKRSGDLFSPKNGFISRI
jgi:replicative DNA helicase Mcm